jgi:hypothetical protein
MLKEYWITLRLIIHAYDREEAIDIASYISDLVENPQHNIYRTTSDGFELEEA